MRKPDYEPVVGMLVQCIDDEWGVQKANCPVRGLIYRVAAVDADITLSGPLGRTLWRGIWIGRELDAGAGKAVGRAHRRAGRGVRPGIRRGHLSIHPAMGCADHRARQAG